MDLTQDCLADVLRASERKVSVEESSSQSVRTLQSASAIWSAPTRLRSYARPASGRHLYLCKKMNQPGRCRNRRRFGGAITTTVMHGGANASKS